MLVLVKGLSEAKVDKILDACFKLVEMGFGLASEMYLKRKNLIQLSTGSTSLD
jgi:hypothetical protein